MSQHEAYYLQGEGGVKVGGCDSNRAKRDLVIQVPSMIGNGGKNTDGWLWCIFQLREADLKWIVL